VLRKNLEAGSIVMEEFIGLMVSLPVHTGFF
jgi:hypothetical protein